MYKVYASIMSSLYYRYVIASFPFAPRKLAPLKIRKFTAWPWPNVTPEKVEVTK